MKILAYLLSLLSVTQLAIAAGEDKQEVLRQLQLPPGFRISLFADDVPNARTLALGDKGVVYVGTRQQGSVYALQDADKDGVAEHRYELAKDLYMPNGVAYRNNQLYVAETNRIIRFNRITQRLAKPPKPVVVYDDRLPSDKHHGWKYLRFGPDGKLYTAVGAPCNICNPEKDIYATLVRLNTNGSDFEILAHGIRNTVGFDWQPGTGALFFTENGRDYLGDDFPPDELNRWIKKGQHFGYPFCHGGTITDPELAGNRRCDEFVAPEWKFKAHMAPLGIRFYTGKQFPERFRNQLFVAQHGSWNRSKPHGYRVALVNFKDGKPYKEQVFISGWLTEDGEVLGRPTDILQMPDGSLLIADDTLGVVYRVEYKK
ncbi:PQQ-dependent sugar dehydrogenase [Methylomarinum vadi]|uniref:PQQ-dependent sugar dehydrogenase n=1 Tax=Methylomarinum vadi TaxID=438855 RepID=UPI0004DF6708|nr:PQQ-dependent sugar dehydrogenase [Methylomarinum vadi]